MGSIGNQRLKNVVEESVRDAITVAHHQGRRSAYSDVIRMIQRGQDAEQITTALHKLMADSLNAEKTAKINLSLVEEAAE